MSVSSLTNKIIYTGSGTTGPFDFDFRVFDDSDLVVEKYTIATGVTTTLTITTDYTVTIDGDGTGHIDTVAAVTSSYKLIIRRVLPLTQEIDYVEGDKFPAETHEEGLDRSRMVDQQLQEQIDRCVKVSVADDDPDALVEAINNAVASTAADAATCTTKASEASASAVSAAASAASIDPLTLVKGDGTVNPTNLLSNADFKEWSAGANAAPDGWTFAGAGASIAREGTIIKLGTYSAKLTRAGTDCYITQTFHTSKGINYWKGRTVTISCWVYATVADRAFIYVYDGVGAYSSTKHTGDSTWQLLTKTFTVDASATTLTATFYIQTGDTSAYFDGAMCVEGSSAFAFSPKPAEEGVWAKFTSTVVGYTGTPTQEIYTKKIGKMVFVSYAITGTSNATNLTFTVPYTAVGTPGTTYASGLSMDNGSLVSTVGLVQITNSDVVSCYKDMSQNAWTNSGTKAVGGQFFYEAA